MKKSDIKEIGLYKVRIQNALLKSENIRDVVLGDTSGLQSKDTISRFRKHVKSHLFIDDTIEGVETYIFFDVYVPDLRSKTKGVKVVIYAICNREILENYSKEGYYGNRADILSEMIEETLLDEDIIKEFGIGDIELESVDIYNSTSFYGRIMVFNSVNFR